MNLTQFLLDRISSRIRVIRTGESSRPTGLRVGVDDPNYCPIGASNCQKASKCYHKDTKANHGQPRSRLVSTRTPVIIQPHTTVRLET